MALSNSDFRKLLNEADASVLASTKEQKKKAPQQQRNAGQISAAQLRRRERYIEILKRKQQKSQKDAEGGKSGGGYRDRADERRKQKEAFYAHVAEELAEIKERSVEESKFLGGDIEHTHLVKGLDLALLAKVRGELNKEQQRKAVKPEEVQQEKTKGKTTLQIRDPRLRKAFHFLFDNLHPHAARFKDRLAHLEMRIMTGLSISSSPARDSFGAGCLSYSFHVGPGASITGFVPTFLRRSALLQENEDGSQREKPKASAAPVQTKVIKEVTEALAWHRENRKKKKEDRLPRRPTGRQRVGAGGEIINDEQADADIFDGAGRFDANAVIAQAQAEAAALGPQPDARTADWIREEGEMELDDEQPASQSPADAHSHRATGARATAVSSLASSRRLADTFDEGDDTYAECYPSYERGQILTRGGADSEDEDGAGLAVPQMDSGEYRDVLNQKRGGKKLPHQFPSQAAYEEYMSSIEYVPKAAYSYGRRIAGEDFSAGKTKKKPKLNPDQEWKAIEKIIAEKHKQ